MDRTARDTTGLSEGAKKLADTVGLDGDLSAEIQEHPELIEFLNEYATWRDNATGQDEKNKQSPSVGHSLKRKE